MENNNESNQFILQAFNEIMIDLCKQLENQHPAYQATIEKIDSRNYFYQAHFHIIIAKK